jgi:hypothetical protein
MSAPVQIVPVESGKGRLADEFIELPHRIYRGCDRWVPQFRRDVRAILSRRNPFFRESSAAFFLARRGSETVGSIAAFDDAPFNAWHKTKTGHFHFFDVYEDPEASHALFDAAMGWMRSRGLTTAQGPIGFGIMGMGILVEGFEHRCAMTMMGYNLHIDARSFALPEKVRRVAEMVLARGNFTVPEFRSKRALARHAAEIGRVYNRSFTGLGEDYLPLTAGEIRQVTSEILMVADPSLIKLLFYKGKLAGLVFGFADLSAALQRCGGRVTALGILDILREYRRTDWLLVNGAAILPEYQRLGGNALLYYELHRIATQKRFLHVDAVQIAETTDMMLSDLKTLGAEVFKRHRIFRKEL